MTAELTRPSKKKEPVPVELAPSGGISINFVPEEPGQHLLDVKKDRRPVKGSPFVIDVAEATGPVSKPTVGNKCGVDFDIPDIKLPDDLKDLKGVLRKPSGKEEPIKCTSGPSNMLHLDFTPDEVGKHLIAVTKKGKPVKGSPFAVDVAPEEPTKPTVGNKCGVGFDIPDIELPKDLKDLKGKLTRPNGIQEPIQCTCSPENTLGLEFTPKEPGKHLIEVTKNNKPVKGSPFVVDVEVEEQNASRPTVGNECDVNLDLPDLKPRDMKFLQGTIKRPSKKSEEPVELKINPDDTLSVSFVPDEPGVHEVNIRKNGKHVTGSPFQINVEAAPSAVTQPVVGSPCDLTLDMVLTAAELRDLKATLQRPDSTKEEPLELKLDSTGHLIISFVPKEVGRHQISIKKGGRHVQGSPIEVMVSAGEKKPGCDIGFEIPGIKLPDDLKHLTGSVTAPNGSDEPVEIHAGPNNKTIMVSFLPKEVSVSVFHLFPSLNSATLSLSSTSFTLGCHFNMN
jgi:filamin